MNTSLALSPAVKVHEPAAVSFAPREVRYIKLGPGGRWARQAVQDGVIPFGYREVDHVACSNGDWETVRGQLAAMGRTPFGIGQGLREIRDFYELPEDTLWVTVADGHLWWAFAAADVQATTGDVFDGPARTRQAIGGWRRVSLTGEALTTSSLSTALTRTANYRMTICGIEREDYLLRRIRGEDDPLHAQARVLKQQMLAITTDMVRQLHWEEFETLVDLIFARNGWRRVGVLGKDQPDIDLLLEHPITGERAWVQVKSKASQGILDDYLDRFTHDGSCQRFFFVCHSPTGRLTMPEDQHLHLWSDAGLAETVLEAGLFDWLMQRTR